MEYILSNNSAITVHKFDKVSELASDLLPGLTSGSVAISGGTTYETLFKAWADLAPELSGNWYCAVDERVVLLDDDESNWGKSARELFIAAGVPEMINNHYTTMTYLKTLLHNRFDTKPYIFDTVFLGAGEDGHTASIFPGTPSILDMTSEVIETVSPRGVKERISLGLKVLIDAKDLITVISGKNKRDCIKWLIEEDISKPFIAVMANRKHSNLYLDSELYSLLKDHI